MLIRSVLFLYFGIGLMIAPATLVQVYTRLGDPNGEYDPSTRELARSMRKIGGPVVCFMLYVIAWPVILDRMIQEWVRED